MGKSSFGGFSSPKPDKKGKYNIGNTIEIANTSMLSFPTDYIANLNMGYVISMDYDVLNDVLYFSYYVTSSQVTVIKMTRSTIYPKYQSSVQVTLTASGTPSPSGGGALMEYGNYIYVSAGSKIYKLNKSDLSTVTSALFGDYYVHEIKLSYDGSYIYGIYRTTSDTVYAYKCDFNLGSSVLTNTGLGYNYVFCGVDNRNIVFGYGTSTSGVIDTKTMNSTTGSQYYLAMNGAYCNYYHRRSFWSNGFFYLCDYLYGRIYKYSVLYNPDGSIASISSLINLTFYSSNTVTYFNFDSDYIFIEKCSITGFEAGNALVNKSTLTVDKFSNIRLTSLLDNASTSFSQYVPKLDGYISGEYVSYNGQQGYTGKIYLVRNNFKITK